MTGIGPDKVGKLLARTREKSPAQDDLDVRFEDLLTKVLENPKKKDLFPLPREVIKALVEAMAYEPATVSDAGKLLYSVAPPTETVDHFLDDFVRSDDNLLSRECELAVCPGPSPAHSHTHTHIWSEKAIESARTAGYIDCAGNHF